MVHHSWQGHSFWVSPQRFIFWEQEKTIVISDLHLGKTGHFRKEGIAVPQQVYKEDLQRLFTTLQQFKPERLLIVGDMAHSRQNKELDWFVRWRNDFSQIDFTLIKGNHDILKTEWYAEHGINVFDSLQVSNLLFKHEHNGEVDVAHLAATDKSTTDDNVQTVDNEVGDKLNKTTKKHMAVYEGLDRILPAIDRQPPSLLHSAVISGHVHPGIHINGVGKQSMHLPCFCFSENHLLLPAYSKFTGLYTIKPTKQDAVFLIVGDKVVKV